MTDTTTRNADLRRMLRERRRELQADVRRRVRAGRADRVSEVRDDLEHTDADSQGDLELALQQMKTETLNRIDEALTRLDAGEYGSCFECTGEIADRRLRALPFAVRCQACEQKREQAQGRARQDVRRFGTASLFAEAVGP